MVSEDCVFCRIVKGDSPADVVKETDDLIAFTSINPAAQTHVLVIPKKHIKSFIDIKKDDKLMENMRGFVQSIIEQKEIKSGYKLLFNGGEFQIVPHVHWHILGGKLKEDYQEKI